MPYMCPECETVYRSWPFLKGHLMKVHNHQELKEAVAETFKDYAISDEEAQERKKKKTPEKKQITEVPTEPVERLDALLAMNGIEDEARERCVGIFRLNPSWHYDPYQVEQLLVAQGATKRRELVVSIVKQYIGDLKTPPDIEGSTFSQPGRGGGAGAYGRTSGGVGGEYPGYPRPGGGAGFVTHEELYRQQETQKLEQQVQQLLNRTTELEGKLKEAPRSGHQAGEQAGDQRTMTIADEHGNPIIIPYDPVYMDVLRREQEAKARKAEREEMLTQMAAFSGKGTDTEAMKAALKPLEEAVQAARAEATEMRRKMEEQAQKEFERRAATAEERAAAAERKADEAKEMAAAAAKGDKTMADYLGEAGTEAKDAIQKAAKDVKDGLTEAGDRVASIVTGRTPARREAPKSPGEVAAIMEAENEFLTKLQPKGG